MRRNLTGTSSRGKFFNTCLKATVLVLLFAVLCLAFSFSVSGVASADTSVSQVFANSSSASANEAVVSGSDDENEAVTSGEATAAAQSDGGSSWLQSDVNIGTSGTSRELNIPSVNFSDTYMSWWYSGSSMDSVSGSGGSLTLGGSGHTSDVTFYAVLNYKLKNPEITYLLNNGASLTVTISAKYTLSENESNGFWVKASNSDNTMSSAKKAGDLGSSGFVGDDSTKQKDNSYDFTNKNAKSFTFNSNSWNDNNANSDGICFMVAFRVYQKSQWFGGMKGNLSASVSVTLNLPSDSTSPYNTADTSSTYTSPYITSMSSLPLNYGDTATDTEGAYTRFPNLLTDLENSVDGIASTGSNTDTLNLKSYRTGTLGSIASGSYYKKTYLTITENSLIRSINIAATGTESVVFNYYENQTDNTIKKGWVKDGDGANVYYYELKRTSVKAATLYLYFAQNTKLTITTSDYVGNSAGVTVINVAGIEANDSDLSKLSVLSANGDDTAVELLNSGNWGGDTSWIYSLKAGDNGNSVLNFAVERTNDTEYVAHLVYFYRLYYSPSLAGLSSATEVMPNGVSSFHYTNGYILGYKNATSFNVDLALTDVANNSGYYRLEVSVANLAGTNKNGTAKNIYYFKVDNDTEESTLTSDVKYTDNVGNVSFTDYLTNEYGLKYYWLGLKDLNSNGLYPTLVTTITLAGETRKGSLATTLGNNLSGNTLKYTKANGDEAVVVIAGGKISSIDSSGGTVGSYEFMGATLDNVFFDDTLYISYSEGVFTIWAQATEESNFSLETTFTVYKGTLESGKASLTSSGKSMCYFAMDFQPIGSKISMSDEGGYLADYSGSSTGWLNQTSATRKWYTESWSPTIKTYIPSEGEDNTVAYFGVIRNRVFDKSFENADKGEDMINPTAFYFNGLGSGDYTTYLNYLSASDYKEYISSLTDSTGAYLFDYVYSYNVIDIGDGDITLNFGAIDLNQVSRVSGLYTVYGWTVDQAGNVSSVAAMQILVDANNYTIASFVDKDMLTEFGKLGYTSDDFTVTMLNSAGEETFSFVRGDVVSFNISWNKGVSTNSEGTVVQEFSFVPNTISLANYTVGGYSDITSVLYTPTDPLGYRYDKNNANLIARSITVGDTNDMGDTFLCTMNWTVDNLGPILDKIEGTEDYNYNFSTSPTAYVFGFRKIATLNLSGTSAYYNGTAQDIPYTVGIYDSMDNLVSYTNADNFADFNADYFTDSKYTLPLEGRPKNTGEYYAKAKVDGNYYVSSSIESVFNIYKAQDSITIKPISLETTYGGSQYYSVIAFEIGGNLLGDDAVPVSSVVGSDYLVKFAYYRVNGVYYSAKGMTRYSYDGSTYTENANGNYVENGGNYYEVQTVYYTYSYIQTVTKYMLSGDSYVISNDGRYINIAGSYFNLDSDYEYYYVAGLTGSIALSGVGSYTGIAAGLYQLTVGQTFDSLNYNFVYDDTAGTSYRINPFAVKVKVTGEVSKQYGDSDPTIPYAIIATNTFDGISVDISNVILSGKITRTLGEGVGTYDYLTTGDGFTVNPNYSVTVYVPDSHDPATGNYKYFEITKRILEISPVLGQSVYYEGAAGTQITPDTALSYTLDASDRVYASYITGALGVYVVSESDAYITIGTLGVSDDSTFIIELVQISPVGIVDTESYYIEENSNGNLYSATVGGDSSTIYIPSNSPKYTYTDGVYTEISDWSNYPLELVFVKYSYKLSEQAEGYVSLATLNDCTPYVSYVPDGEQVPDDGVSDTPYYVFTYDDGSGDTVTDYYYIENLESQPRYSEYVLSESGDKYISSSISGFVATINTYTKYNALVRVTILSLKNPGNAIFVQKQNITIEFDDEFNAEKINNATVLENYLNDTLGAFNLASSSFFTVKANIDGTVKDLTGGIEGNIVFSVVSEFNGDVGVYLVSMQFTQTSQTGEAESITDYISNEDIGNMKYIVEVTPADLEIALTSDTYQRDYGSDEANITYEVIYKGTTVVLPQDYSVYGFVPGTFNRVLVENGTVSRVGATYDNVSASLAEGSFYGVSINNAFRSGSNYEISYRNYNQIFYTGQNDAESNPIPVKVIVNPYKIILSNNEGEWTFVGYSKEYDGTTTVPSYSAITVGGLRTDDVSVEYSASYDMADADYRIITFKDFKLVGADIANYMICYKNSNGEVVYNTSDIHSLPSNYIVAVDKINPNEADSEYVKITPKSVTLTAAGLSEVSKIYDGTDQLTADNISSLIVGSSDLDKIAQDFIAMEQKDNSLIIVSGGFKSPVGGQQIDVGTGLTISGLVVAYNLEKAETNYIITGMDNITVTVRGNLVTVSFPEVGVGIINKRTINIESISFELQDKSYDATAEADLSYSFGAEVISERKEKSDEVRLDYTAVFGVVTDGLFTEAVNAGKYSAFKLLTVSSLNNNYEIEDIGEGIVIECNEAQILPVKLKLGAQFSTSRRYDGTSNVEFDEAEYTRYSLDFLSAYDYFENNDLTTTASSYSFGTANKTPTFQRQSTLSMKTAN